MVRMEQFMEHDGSLCIRGRGAEHERTNHYNAYFCVHRQGQRVRIDPAGFSTVPHRSMGKTWRTFGWFVTIAGGVEKILRLFAVLAVLVFGEVEAGFFVHGNWYFTEKFKYVGAQSDDAFDDINLMPQGVGHYCKILPTRQY